MELTQTLLKNFRRKISEDVAAFVMRYEMDEQKINELMDNIVSDTEQILEDKDYWQE